MTLTSSSIVFNFATTAIHQKLIVRLRAYT